MSDIKNAVESEAKKNPKTTLYVALGVGALVVLALWLLVG